MTPQNQTTFGVPGGNCFSACIASILDLPISMVPYFMDGDSEVNLNEFLADFGFWALTLDAAAGWGPPGLYILGGQSERGPHAVVARDGVVIHDPHPSRAGLIEGSEDQWTFLIPLDAGAMRVVES